MCITQMSRFKYVKYLDDNLTRLAHALHVNVSSLIVRDVRKRIVE